MLILLAQPLFQLFILGAVHMHQPSTQRRLSEAQAAYLLIAPFLLVYLLLLVYPFAKGIWISLHDWNLMAVAFNPDAKTFIGTRNYERVMWGRNIVWGPMANPLWQLPAICGAVIAATLLKAQQLSRPTAIVLITAALLMYVATGFHPGEGGRWFDRRFWPTVGNTLVFVSITAPLITALALVLAAALNRQTRSMAILRTLFFLSQVLSVTVVTLVWQLMFSPRQGLLANVANALGGSPVVWLTNEDLAMSAIVITTVWWSLGIALILCLAGLQNISQDLYEAAALDNATGRRAFWHITLPNMKKTITVVVVLQIILHFQVFGQSQLMTKGGPNDATQVLVRYIYQTAFRDSELGRASAMAVFLFFIMAIFSVLQYVIGRESE